MSDVYLLQEKKEDPQTEVQQTHSSKGDVFDIHIPFSALAASIVTAEDQFLNREHSHSSSMPRMIFKMATQIPSRSVIRSARHPTYSEC